MTRALAFLAVLAIVGLIVTGAIKFQRTDETITIQIDRTRVANDAKIVVNKGKQVLRSAEASLDDKSDLQKR